ncbi:hypothetical protein SprV_0702340300 [Sparganum proliferum]
MQSKSISGFIAEAVLQRLESLVFQHHKPKFWARYVDDNFVVIDRDQLLIFKEHLNAVFPDIQFTMEEEEHNQLAFLDVLVCRKDCGGLKTKVFRKGTNTMQELNFSRNHSISHKRNCARTLYRRVETHCNEPEDKIVELQYLRRVFKANSYPHNFVNRCIRKRDERPNRTDIKFWRALPYVKNVSEAVGHLLAPPGVGVAHRLNIDHQTVITLSAIIADEGGAVDIHSGAGVGVGGGGGGDDDDDGQQVGQNVKQIVGRDSGRPGCNCCRLTGHRSPPVEPLPNGQSAGGRAADIAGHLRPAEEVTDWCRWPVCAVFRWGGQCPLGEYQCPDAHAGREYLSQIDSNGLVRVCFESLGLGNFSRARRFSCTPVPPPLFPLLKKPCTRPVGCCRFFHPPEHIRLALIRSRHAATAHAASVRRRQQKAYAASQDDRCLPRQLRQVATRSPPSTGVQSELRLSDQNALEAIKLLSGLMDYGQLLRICAAIVMREHDWSSDAAAAAATEEEKSSELAVIEPLKGGVEKQEVELAAAATVNRQLAAYSNLTEALRAQLALSSKKAI